MVQENAAHPEQMVAYIAARGEPTMTDTMTELFEHGQQRGEVRHDYPARALAQIAISAVSAAHRQELMGGRAAGGWRGRNQRHVMLALEIAAHGFAPRETTSPVHLEPDSADGRWEAIDDPA